MDNKGYLTVKEAAQRACVSQSLIYALLKQQKLPAFRVGVRGRGKWLIAVADLDGFMASCRLADLPVPDDSEYQFLK